MFERSRSDVFVQIDLDGVTIDSEAQKRPTYQRAVKELFGADCTAADFADVLGFPLAETIERLSSKFGSMPFLAEDPREKEPELSVGRIILRHRFELDKAVPLQARPGFTRVLDTLDQFDIPRGVVTSGEILKAGQALTTVGLWDRFDDVVGIGSTCPAGTTANRAKPDRQLYDISAARAGAQEARRFGIEDSVPGVTAAHNSKAEVIYLHDPRVAPHSERAARLACLVTDSVEEVCDFLEDQLNC